MIRVVGLSNAIAALARLDMPATKARGTRLAADILSQAVAESLSHPPGSNSALPALRSGALRASIATVSDTDGAVIFSDAPAAVFQEFGTARMTPRPFLGPAATAHADQAAQAIADTIRAGADI